MPSQEDTRNDEKAEQSRCTEPGDDVAVSNRAPQTPGR
jgi:hypothetical protein